jgi:hypothetical protein
MDELSFPPVAEREAPQQVETALSAPCCPFKARWLAKIANNRQQISHLTHKLLAEESRLSEKGPSTETTQASTILERLQIQQRNLIHAISNFILVGNASSDTNVEGTSSSDFTKSELIQWLKDRGYTSLANKLTLRQGYPWDEIEKIRSPILMEQLVDIYLLCCHKNFESNENQINTQKLVDFAISLARLATTSNQQYSRSYALVDDAKHMLGQLLYLINKDPSLAIKAIDVPQFKEALEKIKDEFSVQIQEICQQLYKNYKAHQETLLQDPEVALNTLIPVVVAKALLTDIGTINVGIIDALSDIFLSQEKPPLNYEVNLSYALTILQRSPKLRAEFENIHSPRSHKLMSNDVIRASLGLSPHRSINDLDTRLTALIALLSHLRQGEDRSCFAVSLAIEILSAHLGFCIKDLRQLLEEGKLTRNVKGIQKDIPFVKRISDENLHKKISFNNQGELIIQGERKAPLWEAPGLQAACQSIGILDSRQAILAAIHELPPLEKTENYQIEVKLLIQKICEKAQQAISNADFDHLYAQACFAFSSQTAQPLLKVWENAIANMAEAEEGSMIKSAILESTLDALQFKLGELRIPPSPLLQHFFLYIQKSLYEKIRLQYDPTLLHSDSDSNAKEGGFVLYHQKQRIDNEKAFRHFILDILLEVNTKMRKPSMSDIQQHELQEVMKILTSYIDSDEFIGYLLARYHPSNKLAVSQLSRGHSLPYERLQYTPWMTQTGNNSKALLKIYFETDKPISAERFIPSGAEEALTNIIDMCKRMSEHEKTLFLNNPNKLKPLCIVGKHRLPFMAGNPSLAKAWQQDCPTKEWIARFVIKPGKEIAETVIDSETKDHFLKHVQENLLPNLTSAERIKSCMKLILQLPEGLTIKEYRTHVLKICQTIPLLAPSALDKLARQIDTALCQSLEPSLKKKLEDSAVHFADTNWCSGIQDIHFCFAVNPGTGELELWEAYANGSHLMALDQQYWLFNQKWEFLTIQELIPDDSTYLLES